MQTLKNVGKNFMIIKLEFIIYVFMGKHRVTAKEK